MRNRSKFSKAPNVSGASAAKGANALSRDVLRRASMLPKRAQIGYFFLGSNGVCQVPFPVGDYNQDRAQHADEGGDKVMRDVERSLKAIGLADHVFRRCKISVQDLKSDIDGYVSDRQNISKHEISRRILAKRAALLAIVERRKDEVVAAKKALPETIRCELISRIEERSALDPDKTLTQNQRRLDVTRYSVSDILEKYAKSHPQVFDTALAILYIVIHGQDEGIGTGIRARAFKQGRDQFQVPASDSPREFESDD